MRKKILLYSLVIAVFLFSGVQTTYSALRVINYSINKINTLTLKGEIVEEYTRQEGLYPGATVSKIVNIKNTGTSHSVIRVRVEKAWGQSKRDADGKLQVLPELNTDNIQIQYDDTMWYYDASEDFFYYKAILAPGELTGVPLFQSFTIDPESGGAYADKEADIRIKLECVQAKNDGISFWKKSFVDLGITNTDILDGATEKPVQSVRQIVDADLYDPNDFHFNTQGSDLFTNFKDLLPGETRTQKIVILNSLKNETAFYLRAEDIEQSLATPENLDYVNNLLQKYAHIRITDEKDKVIYDGPIWGNVYSDKKNPDSMRYDYLLGVLKSGETKTLTVELSVDPGLGNEYQNLWGLIKWVWSADGGTFYDWGDEEPFDPPDNDDDDPTNPDDSDDPRYPDIPKTSDSANLKLWGCVMGASGAVLAVLLVTGKKSKSKQQA